MICVICFIKDNDNHPGDKFGWYLNICARDLQQAANPQPRLHLQAQQVRNCTRWQVVLDPPWKEWTASWPAARSCTRWTCIGRVRSWAALGTPRPRQPVDGDDDDDGGGGGGGGDDGDDDDGDGGSGDDDNHLPHQVPRLHRHLFLLSADC